MTIEQTAAHLFDHVGDMITGGAAALIVSAAVRALPPPEPMGSKVYVWLYNFTHALLANFDRVGKTKP